MKLQIKLFGQLDLLTIELDLGDLAEIPEGEKSSKLDTMIGRVSTWWVLRGMNK